MFYSSVISIVSSETSITSLFSLAFSASSSTSSAETANAACSFSLAIRSSVLNFTSPYLFIPVPAGINLPIITFSLRPTSGSTLPLIAASVRTLVVSWNEAADKNELVASEAFVIPSIICVNLNLLKHLTNNNFNVLIIDFYTL